jgi:hypothetical protein
LRSNSFSAVPRASSPVFIFCASGLDIGGNECVEYRFHVLCSRIHFRRYRERSVPSKCFALPVMFSAVPNGLGPVFMFCAPGLIFDSPEGDRTSFWRVPVFMFYGAGIVFGGMEGVRSRFNVLRARKRGCRVPFSCFALPKSFPEVPRALIPVFMFFAPELIFGGTEGVWSRLHVLCSLTCFWQYGGC